MESKGFDFKKQWPITALLALIVILLIVLVFRGGDSGPSSEELAGTSQSLAGTMVAVQLSEIAKSAPSETPEPTAVPASPTAEAPRNTATSVAGGPCLAMDLGDETIPDDTVLSPGETFTKTWLLTNTGTCTWTEDYGLAFHHGDAMEAVEYVPLAGWVLPGESVFLSREMIAPLGAGSHIGFWSLISPDGISFGPGATESFWVKISILGPTPESRSRSFDYGSGGAIRADGQPDNVVKAGDDNSSQGWQGLITFNFGNLSAESTVTGVVLDFSLDYTFSGDPFTNLGCLNVYQANYGGIDASDYGSASGFALWTFCSINEIGGGARFGGPSAIDAVDSALFANQMQLIMVFDNESNADGIQDLFTTEPNMTISFYDN